MALRSGRHVGVSGREVAFYEAALSAARCDSDELIQASDSIENDVEGARAVGIRAVLAERGTKRGNGRVPEIPLPEQQFEGLHTDSVLELSPAEQRELAGKLRRACASTAAQVETQADTDQ